MLGITQNSNADIASAENVELTNLLYIMLNLQNKRIDEPWVHDDDYVKNSR